MLNFCDFIQVYVFTTHHHLNRGLIVSVFVWWNKQDKSYMYVPILIIHVPEIILLK